MSAPSVLPQILIHYGVDGQSTPYDSAYTRDQVYEAILNCALRHGGTPAPVQREAPLQDT